MCVRFEQLDLCRILLVLKPRPMKRLVALMMCAVSLGVAAQSTITYPFNPDANSDGFVGVSDILEGVATYDNFFSPGEIMVGDIALGEWLFSIQNTLTQQQAEIDSLQNLVGTQTSNDSAGNVNALALGETQFLGDLYNSSMGTLFGYHFFEIDIEGDGFLTFCGAAEIRTYQTEKSHVIDWSEDSVLNEIFEWGNTHGVYTNNGWNCPTLPIPASDKLIVMVTSSMLGRLTWTPIVQSSGEGVNNQEDASDADAIEIPSYSLECVDMGYSPLCGALGFSQWATLEPNYLGHRYNMGWSGPDANNGYLIHDPHWRKFQIRGLPAGIGEIVVEYTNINGDHSFTGVALDFDGEGNAFIYLYATCYSGNSECSGLAIQQGVYDFPLESALGVEHCNSSSMRNLKLHYSDGWSLVSLGLTIDIY